MVIYANLGERIKVLIMINMSKKLKLVSLIVVLFTMVLFTTGCGKEEEEEKPVIKKQVEVQQIARQNQVTASLLASGTVTPKQYSNIRSLVPGTVEYLSPVGSEIIVGQPLFSIRDEGIESGYFNALQNLEQTRVVTDQRVQQAQLGLNSAQARLDLAESQYNSSVAQTDQAVRVAEDSAIVAYSSAYNTLNQAGRISLPSFHLPFYISYQANHHKYSENRYLQE